MKQQSVDRHVTPRGHIVLILSQSVFTLFPYCCVFSGEAANTNFIVFGLIRLRLEPPIYHTRGERTNHYTTDAVACCLCHVVCFAMYVIYSQDTNSLLKLMLLYEIAATQNKPWT